MASQLRCSICCTAGPLLLLATWLAVVGGCATNEGRNDLNGHGSDDGGSGGRGGQGPVAAAGNSGLAGETAGGAAAGAAGAPMGGNCDDPAACGLVECAVTQLEGTHVALCSEITPHTNPATSGPHYPVWAQFGIYDEPIPAGFLLHTLEHSAVALLYNCELIEADGRTCTDLVAELIAFYDAFPTDPLCVDVPHRLVVAPDPNLDVPFAATAWGYHLKGDCFDADRVAAFVAAHYGMNYENICPSGVDPAATTCP